MKNQINKVYSYRLDNGDFFQWIENMVAITKTEGNVAVIMKTLEEDLAQMRLSFKKEKLNAETQKILDKDASRDKALMRLIYLLKAETLHESNPSRVKAADTLLFTIQTFGGGRITKYDLNKETAYLSNLVASLRAQASEVALLDLQDDINYIDTTNTEFKTLYQDRGDAATQLNDIVPFYKLRKTVETHYRETIAAIESLPKIMPPVAPQINDLIARLNTEIDKFNLLVPAPATKKQA